MNLMDVVNETGSDWEQKKKYGNLCCRYNKLFLPQHIRREIATEEPDLKRYVCNIVSWRLIPITGYLFLKAVLNVTI